MVKEKGLHNIGKIIKRFSVLLLILMVAFTGFVGCANIEPRTVILSTGFNSKVVFKIEDRVCTLPELKVYLYNLQDQYVKMYGPDILEVSVDGESLSNSIRDNALADVSQIKAMNIAAFREGIKLDDEEKQTAKKAASEYYKSLSDYEKQALEVDESILADMYMEYALANTYYGEMIKDINPEISDDEARTITVQHILIKTYSIDGSGKKIEFSGEEKKNAMERATQIQKMATDGEHDFEELVLQYSEGEKGEYSFCMGETEKAFEEAAFNLGKDEISDVVTTQYGYHIIKCISTFNREETDLNKIRIAESQREEAFGKGYDDFATTLITNLNEELWNSVTFSYDENISTQNFFDIYRKYFN